MKYRVGLFVLAVMWMASAFAAGADALRFEKSGQGARTLILIPGLGCGGGVWADTAAALKSDYTIYTLTLAGFDGTPAIKAPLAEQWADAIAKLIESEKLNKPTLIGHSLGGNVALRVGIRHPDAAGAIIVVDGMPIFPPLPADQTLEKRKAQTSLMADMMRQGTPEQFVAQTKASMGFLVTKPADAEMLGEMASRADRETFIEAIREIGTTDLRPDLPKIKAPVVVIVPVAPDGTRGQSAEQLKAYVEKQYTDAFKGTPTLKLTYIPDSKHFVMYDQPKSFQEALRAELSGVK